MEIVLIDDSNISNLITKALLKSHSQSMEIKIFEDATIAYNYIANDQLPKLVLLDLNMPKITGWEFLEMIQKDNLEHLKVIILTSSVDINDKNRAKKNKMVLDFITKPLRKLDFEKYYLEYFKVA